jgi:two-component system sensor histidine kinase and response regulator WspE
VSDAEDLSLFELFRGEVESHATVLNEGLIALEARPGTSAAIEPLMRAAHSIKGAARVVGLDAAVRIAHAMEDALVAAQEGRLTLAPARVDLLLRSVDWIVALSGESEEALPGWLIAHAAEGEDLEQGLAAIGDLETEPAGVATAPTSAAPAESAPSAAVAAAASTADNEPRAVKVTAEALSRLTGLAAESLVEARRLEPLAGSLQQLKARQNDVADLIERLRESVVAGMTGERVARLVGEAQRALDDCRQALVERIADLDARSRHSEHLSGRLYDQVVSSRMRPFSDGTQGLARLVRDVARQLGKQARLEIDGRATEVDREILEDLEAPLNHLLRNALDHGIETPADRVAAGKAAEGRIRVEASHSGGMLRVRVSDDGRGIEPTTVRRRVVERGLASADMAERMTDAELLDFLLLPGFSTRDAVSEISGRGVGLDVVQSMVQAAGGALRIASEPGRRTEFELRLPVTRSVLRALVVVIAGEPYAFPLARTERVLAIDPSALRTVEGRVYVAVDGESVALVPAREVLEVAPIADSRPHLEVAATQGATRRGDAIAAVVVGEPRQRFALEVDGFVGECDLVVRPLDRRLGKVPDVAAASTLEDGSPIFILDVEDLVRSIDALVSGGRLTRARRAATGMSARRAKRVLVVEDSLTVRELERRLLESEGYEVEVAVDGMEGWNAVRLGDYDLVLTDVDMPRMHGIDLVRRIKADARLRALPVVIVSYKDREEDRLRGLEAGADHYLTKSSFQDEMLARVVRDLIGGPTA